MQSTEQGDSTGRARWVRALPVLVTALLAAFLVQFRWALHHDFGTFPWRWLATAAVLGLALSPLLFVARRLRAEVRLRWEQGLRYLPVLGLLPLAAFFDAARNRLAVAAFVVGVLLSLLRALAPADGQGRMLRWFSRAFVFGVLVYAAAAPVAVDGVTLELAGPRRDDYYWAARELPAPDEAWGGQGTFRSASKDPVLTIPVAIPALRGPAERLHVGVSVRTGRATLRAMAFDSSLLLWNFSLARLSVQELLDRGMAPVEADFTPQPEGVTVRATGDLVPQFSIPWTAVRATADGATLRQAIFRGLWLLVMAGGVLLARRVAMLDKTSWLRPWAGLGRALVRAPEAPPVSLRAYHRDRIGWIAAGVGLLLVLLFLRTGANLLHPGFYVEDANFAFSYFYGNERPFRDSLYQINGYTSLVYSYAWLVAKADVLWQPTLYLWGTVAMSVTAASLLSFSGLLRDRLTLLFAPTVLGLSGIVHVFLWITLVYQMHVTALSLIILLLFPPPETRTGAAVQALAMTYFVWAAPFAVVAAPLAALLLVLRLYPGWRKAALLVYAIVCALLYYRTVRVGVATPSELFAQPGMLEHYWVLLVEKILLFDVFRPYAHWKVLAVVAGVAAMTWLLRRDALYLKIAVALWCAMLGGLAVYFLSRKYEAWDVKPHYLQITLYCWWLYILITLDRAVTALRVPRRYVAALWSVVLAVVAYDNVLHPDKGSYQLQLSVPRFVETVKQYERQADALAARNETVLVWTDGHFGDHPVDNLSWATVARIGSKRPDAVETEVHVPLVLAH